jgi:hypothetical protein
MDMEIDDPLDFHGLANLSEVRQPFELVLLGAEDYIIGFEIGSVVKIVVTLTPDVAFMMAIENGLL